MLLIFEVEVFNRSKIFMIHENVHIFTKRREIKNVCPYHDGGEARIDGEEHIFNQLTWWTNHRSGFQIPKQDEQIQTEQNC